MDGCLLGFNGERRDPVNKATHLGNGYRAYDPVLMRFHCPDSVSPFGAGGMNAYAYCAGDPANRADPGGHHSVGGWLGIFAGVALGVALSPLSGGSSLAMALSVTTLVVSTGLAVAEQFVEASDPTASAALGWAALAVGFTGESALMRTSGQSLAGLAVGRAGRLMDSLTLRVMPLLSKLRRVNGQTGIPLSGEFRNARFLGRSMTEGRVTWNLRFEDDVPLGRRLTIMMSGYWEDGLLNAYNEIRENGNWIVKTYQARALRTVVLAPGENFSVYRLAMPDSGLTQRARGVTFASEFRSSIRSRGPSVGFQGNLVVEGPVAEALRQNNDLLSSMASAGFGHLWGPESAQHFLNGLSAQYGNVAGSIVLRGDTMVYPSSLRLPQNEVNWQ